MIRIARQLLSPTRSLLISKCHTPKAFQHTKPKLSISGEVVSSFGNAHLFPEKLALRDNVGSYTYANLFLSAKELASEIGKQLSNDKPNRRIMFLCPNDADYVITLWAIWMSGHIAVPLSPLHPKNMLLYYANDTNSSLLITTPTHKDLMQQLSKNTNIRLHVVDDKSKLNALEKNSKELEYPLPARFYDSSDALILYTSGTTGNQKGVLLTHKSLVFQINTLLDAWKWSPNDMILHTLPLHHVHGLVNALLCPLYIGAKVSMLEKFDAKLVWSRLLGLNDPSNDRRVTVFMAVPTIYAKLIDEYERLFGEDAKMVDHIQNVLHNRVRLMVSGSAALTEPVFKRWREISGHSLLERYGMSETGMILSNLYGAEQEPGYVGLPLGNISVRLIDGKDIILECTNKNNEITCNAKDKYLKDGCFTGELLVKSEGLFKEYFGRPEATKKEFTEDGWFITGDVCSYVTAKNKFKVLGRKNMDFIKSGGYKISSLEVENVLLSHSNVKECVVVGVEDEEWGERVTAVIRLAREDSQLDEVKEFALLKLPKYSVPTVWKVVEEIPRNAMGKVNKKEVAKTVSKESN